MQYYVRIVDRGSGPEASGLYRKAIADSVRGDARFNGFTGEWEYTTRLSLGLSGRGDDVFEPITEEEARARITKIAPAVDPDAVLAAR